MHQILIVEDDNELNKGLCSALRAEDRQVIAATNLKGAVQQMELGSVNLVLLDVNLPDGNGMEFLSKAKQKYPDTPIIILTANDTDFDIVEGLEKGADDYITKPFSLSVLRARVNTQLRKHSQINRKTEKVIIDNFCFDFNQMIFSVSGQSVELSKTEQKLLRILVENQGITLRRGELVDKIWTDGAEYVEENALSVTVKRLRDKLGASQYIKTVYGIGYSWVKKNE